MEKLASNQATRNEQKKLAAYLRNKDRHGGLTDAERGALQQIDSYTYLPRYENQTLPWQNNKGGSNNYGSQIKVSGQKMYQQGDHFNKHGRDMGYTGKKDYEAGARKFIEDNRNTADIFEGVWNSSRGGQSGQTQIIIRSEGRQAIINKSTGQIIDFYEGTSLDGFINIGQVQ